MKVSANTAQNYYYERDPIFSKTEPGSNAMWIGSGARELGLLGKVDLNQFDNLMQGLDPKGEIRLVGKEVGPQAHKLNAATDIPLSIPKSISIAALLDHQLRDAIQKAAVSTAEGAERHIYGRQAVHGATDQVPGKMVAALFFHGTSRANDAHMHGHLVIANMVTRPDGSFSTLENRELFRAQREITQDFYSNLAKEIKEIGYGIELRRGNAGQIIPELAGHSTEVNDLFSKRHQAIHGAEQLRADLLSRMPNLTGAQLDSLVQLQSKSRKNIELTEADLVRNHSDQLEAVGINATKYMAHLKEAGQTLHSSPSDKLSPRDYINISLQHTTEKESVFSRPVVINDAIKLSIGEYTRPDLEKAWDEATMAGNIVQYSDRSFTTPEMEQIETRIIENVVQGSKAFSPLMSDDDASKAIQAYEATKGFKVTEGQASAVQMVLTTTDRLSIIAGDAGAGKTTVFEAVNQAVGTRENVRLIGLGFQGKATAVMEESSGIQSQTIDSFLLRNGGKGIEGGRQIWAIDEASMLGSRHLDTLLQRAENENAQIILVGDTKQIAAISAGKMLAELQRLDLVQSTVMDEGVRQQTDWTKELANALKGHDLDRAFSILSREEKISEIADRDERIAATAGKYVAAVVDGRNPLAMTVTNSDRRDLIGVIRDLQKEAGQIGKEDITVITREPINLQGVDKRLASSYEAGNFVVFNSAVGSFREGAEAEILTIDPRNNSITVVDQQGKTAEIPLRQDGAKLSVYREQETAFSEGERGIFLKNDNTNQGKFSGIKNGVTFEIKELQSDGMATLQLENGNTIQRNLNGESITHGQAITVDKSQGASAHTGIVMTSSDGPAGLLNANRNYVAMSRMSHDMELVTDSREQLLEAVRGEQIKTSTTEHTITDDRLAKLKNEIADLSDREPSSPREEYFQQNPPEPHSEIEQHSSHNQHQEVTLEI